MNDLNDPDKYDWKNNPGAEEEFRALKMQLAQFYICPEESIGMKRLRDLDDAGKQKAFETYAVPRIKDAQKGEGHKGFVDHWKDMTFERWAEEEADAFLEDDMPELMKHMPRAFGPFGMMAGWMSFRGKVIGGSEILPANLCDEAYTNMEPSQMLDYAERLEEHTKKWETDNEVLFKQIPNYEDKLQEWTDDNDFFKLIRMNDEQKEEHTRKMMEKYGNEFIGFRDTISESGYYDYRNIVNAVAWLRFWAELGHGMYAWY